MMHNINGVTFRGITSYLVVGHSEPGQSCGTHIHVPSGPKSAELAEAVLSHGKSGGMYDKNSYLRRVS